MGPGRRPKQAIKNAWLGVWYTREGMQDWIQAPAGEGQRLLQLLCTQGLLCIPGCTESTI